MSEDSLRNLLYVRELTPKILCILKPQKVENKVDQFDSFKINSYNKKRKKKEEVKRK